MINQHVFDLPSLLHFQINSHLYDFRLKDTMKESIICMIMKRLYKLKQLI